jgi:hypothetical protein
MAHMGFKMGDNMGKIREFFDWVDKCIVDMATFYSVKLELFPAIPTEWEIYVSLHSKLTLQEVHEIYPLCMMCDVSMSRVIDRCEEFHDGRCFVEHVIGILSNGGEL